MSRIWVGFSAVLMLLIAACGGGEDIEVSDVWGRPSPAAASNGAFYMVISNNADGVDHLVGAASEACGFTELHESKMSDGVMSMSPVGPAGIEVPAGGEAVLEVGGLHVMCIDKQADFVEGDSYEITLEFDNAGEVIVEAEIREG
ncbi:MAG: copper chaperone PCu(A)C [Acidimicrobiia bacterium]|nr:copper chaperone PCu(A)C [Acidimicrobiia bacterium]